LDVLSLLPELSVCTTYELTAAGSPFSSHVDDLPSGPIYETLPGWQEISHVRHIGDLPPAARGYSIVSAGCWAGRWKSSRWVPIGSDIFVES
jgi:adenylosuccinate synthase